MGAGEGFLTLTSVAENPGVVSTRLVSPTGELLLFRPLGLGDETRLADFLRSLSPETRRFCVYPGYGPGAAREMCAAIARYDKLRMVAAAGAGIVALFEFSFGITDRDRERYVDYGVELDERSDCRFGACVADAHQIRGLGSALLPLIMEIARRFGKQRVILWGGVLAENHRAIRYYEKHLFRMLGRFRNDEGAECRDGMLLLSE